MRKVILDLAVTLDGVIEGANGEIDWCIMDDDMDFDGFLSTIDAIFYGRISYDAWGNFCPDEMQMRLNRNFGRTFIPRKSTFSQVKTEQMVKQLSSVLILPKMLLLLNSR